MRPLGVDDTGEQHRRDRSAEHDRRRETVDDQDRDRDDQHRERDPTVDGHDRCLSSPGSDTIADTGDDDGGGVPTCLRRQR